MAAATPLADDQPKVDSATAEPPVTTEGAAAPAEPAEAPTSAEGNQSSRVVVTQRAERVDPPAGKAALEASEAAPAKLVPKTQRKKARRGKRPSREIPPESPVYEEVLVDEEEQDAQLVRRGCREARAILDDLPLPNDSREEIPEEILGEAVDYGDISSEASFEILDAPVDLIAEYKAKEEEKEKTEAKGLAAPPLYAAGVTAQASQPSASSSGVETLLEKALDLSDQIQGALSQSSKEVSKKPSKDGTAKSKPAHGSQRDRSSSAGSDCRAKRAAADQRKTPAGKRTAGAAAEHSSGTIAAILSRDGLRRRLGSTPRSGKPRRSL